MKTNNAHRDSSDLLASIILISALIALIALIVTILFAPSQLIDTTAILR